MPGRPKRLTDAMLGELDARAVDFSANVEFDDGFFVACRDEAFARAVLGPEMVGYLLRNHGWFVEVRRRDTLVYDGEQWPAERFRDALEFLSGFIGRLPAAVRDRYMSGARPAVSRTAGSGAGRPG